VAPVVDDGDVATLDMCDALVGVVHKAIPVLDRKVPTRIAASNAFLYQQPDPLQIGVETTRLVDNQVAVVHGKIKHRDGTPLDGVRITVHGHDEYGRTNSRPDGKFDLVVGGGGPLTVQYRKAGFLPVDRLIATRWRRDAVLDDVVMITADTEATEVTTDQPGIQLAIGSVQTDEDGSRRAVLAFAGDTHATAELPNGTTAELDTLHVRATEYSVGETGPEALPAKLPEQTAYTYAVELSVDEAEAMGAERVQFDKPVRMYVDNFLHWRGDEGADRHIRSSQGALGAGGKRRGARCARCGVGHGDRGRDGRWDSGDRSGAERMGHRRRGTVCARRVVCGRGEHLAHAVRALLAPGEWNGVWASGVRGGSWGEERLRWQQE